LSVLVVLCHPNKDGFTHAAARAACDAAAAAGHRVTVLDLYGECFDPVMSREELRRYKSNESGADPVSGPHVEAVRAADVLVFVYPTWWSGLPAMLKGWLDKVMVPGVAFVLDGRNKVRPALGRVRRIVVVSTYGSPRRYVRFVNDNGRRMLTRALRMSTGWRARTTHVGLYSMDTATPADRERHLARVTEVMGSL
jgi:putative NADPH-quinone reductase